MKWQQAYDKSFVWMDGALIATLWVDSMEDWRLFITDSMDVVKDVSLGASDSMSADDAIMRATQEVERWKKF